MIEEYDAELVEKEVAEAAKKLRWHDEKKLTESEMINLAKEIAYTCNWLWLEPVVVVYHRSFGLGAIKWVEVQSNANCRGINVRVYFDPESTQVISANFTKR